MPSALLLVACIAVCSADTYLHNPRGSNNRLNEPTANRQDADRLFDSENNNRGGYNKGDYGPNAASGTPEATLAEQYLQQYDEFYYMSEPNWNNPNATTKKGRTQLTIEWTNQHGCGGNEQTDPQITNCDIVLQYMCFPEPIDGSPYSIWNRVREDCNNECFVPRPDNPDCSLPNPQCDTIPLDLPGPCALAGGIWLPGSIIDKYNCPHECNGDSTAGSRTDCGSNTWETATRRVDQGEYFPRLRDGTTTDRQEYTDPSTTQDTEAQRYTREWNGGGTGNGNGDVRLDRGLHEDWEWYDECYRRERNHGLFTADQNLRDNNLGYSSAIYTRQNPNGNRRGYECPEERDYYPYWHPSPWTDIAILTDRLDQCEFYQTESQNVKSKWLCRNTANCPNCIRYNNEAACRQNGGRWAQQGARNIAPPVCQLAPWTRDNHNGNTRGGEASRYNWTLPYLSLPNGQPFNYKCVLRLRYNITTEDYNPWRVNSSFNQDDGAGVRSPVQQNPTVNIGANNQGLRLAINTAQYGRTFQDRSHVFTLKTRPYASANPPLFEERNIYNVNVRGKRGNIVQVYPAVEYDFIPNQLYINDNELVHFQWTGSNTHNNGAPGGDGQTGDAGEGRGGTDRHNVVELDPFNFAHSFPQTWEQNTMFSTMQRAFSEYYPATDGVSDWRLDWALRMATVGYYGSYNGTATDGTPAPDSFLSLGTTNAINPLLNNARASYEGGVFQFMMGTYNYMCTRNHNFSNRDQKGHIVVTRAGVQN